MKSLKKKNRLTKIVTAGAIVFVAITPQIVSNIPPEYAVLGSLIVIPISEAIDQYLTERRVTRAEDIKTKEYGEHPEDHLKEEYNKLVDDGSDDEQ